MATREPDYIDEAEGEDLRASLHALYRALLSRLLFECSRKDDEPVDPKVLKVAVQFLHYSGVRVSPSEPSRVASALSALRNFDGFPFK